MIVNDNETWVEEQFGGCDLGDKRRTSRLEIVAKNMLENSELLDPPASSARLTHSADRFDATTSVNVQ